MDPTTAMMLGTTALTAISKIGEGYANSSLAQFQASIAASNATNAASEGQLSLDQGRLQQSRTVASIDRTIGAETGKFAASGLNPAYGSPLLLEGFSAGQGATDLALIGAKAELGNAQSLATAASDTGQASAFGFQATNDVMAGYLGAATALGTGMSANNNAQWNALSTATSSIASGVGNAVGGMFMPGGNWWAPNG